MIFDSEKQLADTFLRHASKRMPEGTKVYDEVKVEGVGVADMVLIDPDGWTTIVEAKLGASFQLLAQARRWVNFANRVMACIPALAKGEARLLVFETFRAHSVGIAEVTPTSCAYVTCKPCMSNDDMPIIRFLRDEQAHGIGQFASAGTRGEMVATDATVWLAGVFTYVRAHGETRVRHLASLVPHPFKSDSDAVRLLKSHEHRVPNDLQFVVRNSITYLAKK